jgi:rhodanese-related sulfurtransferase
MSVKRVSPEEAFELVRDQGYVYLDVRSVAEFEQGHPAGAYNAPVVHMGPMGSQPNADFLPVIERRFPKEAALVLGCRTSGRSEHAATLLERAGYSNLVVQRAGFAGSRDALGRPDPGWAQKGLPTSRQAEPGRAWEDLKADAP